MVFSSIPSYLDSSNWQQHQNHQIIGGSSSTLLQPPQPHGSGAIRPGSMAERARLANIPMPEAALKCPRCESANTKFCYFNNYSLSQPRHFCKTCRRYWTRGGALRSVPVGGGCRRNKRSKSTSSKSPASGDRQPTSSSTSTISSNSPADNMFGLQTPPSLPPLRFFSPLSQLNENFIPHDNMGLNYSGISSPTVLGTSEMNFHLGSSLFAGGGGGNSSLGIASLLSSTSGGNIDPWRFQPAQHFPFFGSLDPSASAIYQLPGGENAVVGGEMSHQGRPKLSSSMLSQMASVKLEESNPELNLSKQPLVSASRNDQWNPTSSWGDLSSFNSFSTTNPL